MSPLRGEILIFYAESNSTNINMWLNSFMLCYAWKLIINWSILNPHLLFAKFYTWPWCYVSMLWWTYPTFYFGIRGEQVAGSRLDNSGWPGLIYCWVRLIDLLTSQEGTLNSASLSGSICDSGCSPIFSARCRISVWFSPSTFIHHLK